MKTATRPRSSHPTGLHLMIRNPHPDKKSTGDCGTRSLCLALDLPYRSTWNKITQLIRSNYFYRYPGSDWQASKRTANGGVCKRIMSKFLYDHGWRYYSAPAGSLFKAENLPELCIAEQSGHWVCIRDGAVWDTYDSRGKRARKLKGWFAPAKG